MIKLLLVDDETTTRKGLVKHIPWIQLGVDVVEEAKDGFDAIAAAERIEPDILLSDIRMPGMNGIELAKRIREQFPECIVIFLSGYSDKEYLKEAIKLRAVSYVEKPINISEVKETVAKAVAFYHEEQRKRQAEETVNMTVSENLPFVKQKIIMSLIRKGENHDEALKKLELMNISFEKHEQFTVFIIKLNSKIEQGDGEGGNVLRLLEIVDRMLADIKHISAFKDNEHIIVISSLGINQYQNIITGIYSSIRSTLFNNKQQDMKSFCAVGQVVNGVEEIFESYLTAVVTLQKLFFYGYDNIVFYKGIEENSFSPDDGIYAKFTKYLSEQRNEDAASLIENLYRDIKSHDTTLVNNVKNIFFKLVFQLLMEAEKRGVFFSESGENEEKYLWDLISNFQTLEEIKSYVISKITLVAKRIEELEASSRTVFQVKRHIEKNYGDENLSTKALAEMVYLTPAYLSGLFRKETGKTISEYIIEIRVEKSKEFLRDVRLKLFEVARNVGYNDANYYAKTFKKYTGLTPSEYREKYLS